ncbi:zinc finger protein [Anaeramoeba flamelloides]|uniref:Zinc finger protein n=1 Tax=Anaeramoeba flamelloides TaxID=1746091 RepID=A0AAV8ACN7_9EUKA|nr:zinc finger protein [Anaeramoeba flamelloides]
MNMDRNNKLEEEMKKERKQMKAKRNKMEQRKTKLENERDVMIQVRDEMQEKRKEMQAKSDEMQEERKEMQEERKKIQEERNEIQEKLRGLQLELLIFDEDFDELKEHLKNAKEDYEKKKKIGEMIISVRGIDEKNVQISKQNQQIDKQNVQIDKQDQQIDKQDQRIDKQNELIKEQNLEIKEQNELIKEENNRIDKQFERVNMSALTKNTKDLSIGKVTKNQQEHKTQEFVLQKIKKLGEEFLQKTQLRKDSYFKLESLNDISSNFQYKDIEEIIPFVNRKEEMQEIATGMIEDFLSMKSDLHGSQKFTNLTWFGSSGCGKTRMSKSIFFRNSFYNIFMSQTEALKTNTNQEQEKKINNLNHSFENFKKHHLFLYNSFRQNLIKKEESENPEKSLFYRILMAISEAIKSKTQIKFSDCKNIDNLFEIFEPIQKKISKLKNNNNNKTILDNNQNNNENEWIMIIIIFDETNPNNL